MKVILSIKPQFAEKIFDGSKRFEFRRNIFKNQNVKTVVVYASSPISMVIGEFEIEKIFQKELDDLWDLTNEFSGITKEYFDEYFIGKDKGFAIKVKKTRRYSKPKDIQKEFKKVPPQSFTYL